MIIVDNLLEYTVLIFNHVFTLALPNMLALCLVLLASYHAQNYTGILGWSLYLI